MTRKKALCLIIVLLLVFSGFGGCAGMSAGTANTKVVTDILGREVTIPKDPQRIVCLYAATAHMMTLAGETEKIIGAPGGIKRDILLRTKYPDIVNISSPAQEGTINAEEIVRINPDLVLVRRNIVDSVSESEKLDKLGLPYVVVDFYSIDDIKKSVEIVGEIFNKQEIATKYTAYMDETLAFVDERLEGLNENEKVSLYHTTNDALKTDAEGSLGDEITRRAGVINVSVQDGPDTESQTKDTTLEQIYIWDPDAIIANEYYAVDYIMMNDKWSGLSAVKNGQVFSLPLGISRWCHQGSIEPHMAVLYIAWHFYPERFSDIDMEETIKDYYTRFFELDIDDELVERIITGEGMREPKGN